jgi:hypothetical protein
MRPSRPPGLAPAAVALAALGLATCGGGGGEQPTAPAAPAATPLPAPTPEPPVSASCERLPLGSPTYTCRDEGAEFLSDVSDAIDALKLERPEYFRDGNFVTNLGGYYVGLIRILDRKGLCAAYDGEELAVKRTNEYSEQYKVLTSWNEIRRAYMGTCAPAWFPLARTSPAPSPPGCALPPSSGLACGRSEPRFLGDAEAAIDQVMGQRPELFDFGQTAPGTDWPLVKDLRAYQLAVVDVLGARGYCGLFDGEEIQVKRSNEFSEHFDVNLSDRYVRRGPGIFRGSCYPAAF